MNHNRRADDSIEQACWDALELATSIGDPVQRLMALQETTDEIASAQRHLESAKLAALAEALQELSVERLTLQIDGDADILAMVQHSRPMRPTVEQAPDSQEIRLGTSPPG